MTTVITEIVDQHAEDAAFLWGLHDRVTYAPHYSLSDLVVLDGRIDAHLDGLYIAAEVGWEACKEALSSRGAGEFFAASILAFSSGNEDRITFVLDAGSNFPQQSRGVIAALDWLSYKQAEEYICRFTSAPSSSLRRIGIAAAAAHRRDIEQALVDALSDDDLLLRACALRAVGELGRADLLPELLKNLAIEDERCRFSAAWSAALLAGDAKAIEVLTAIVESNAPDKEEALQVALRRMSLAAAHGWMSKLAQQKNTLRSAVVGAGILGDPESVPWLIEQMSIPALARVAGEAFTMITGVDIAIERLEGEKPKGFESGPTEDPEDENVEMDMDEHLPWPEPEAIAKWWGGNYGRFQKGTRYLVGQPIKNAWLQAVLRRGYQRQRAAAALELTRRQPGQPLFNVSAPGWRQKQILSE